MGIEGLDGYRDRFRDEANQQIGMLMREEKRRVGVALMAKVIDVTPVDEGEARRGWHFSSPRPDGVNVQTDDPYSPLVGITESADPMDPLYLENRVDHIRVLEDGTFVPPNPGPSKDPRKGRTGKVLVQNGYSVQAPRGISGDALDAVAAEFNLTRITTSE